MPATMFPPGPAEMLSALAQFEETIAFCAYRSIAQPWCDERGPRVWEERACGKDDGSAPVRYAPAVHARTLFTRVVLLAAMPAAGCSRTREVPPSAANPAEPRAVSADAGPAGAE